LAIIKEGPVADPIYCLWLLDAPCLRPEIWAAWAQALLSAMAIYAAARLASRQERLAFRRRADAYLAVMTHVEQSIFMASEAPHSEENIALVGSAINQLRSVPMDAVPDLRLMMALNRCLLTLTRLHGELTAAPSSSPVMNGARILGRKRMIGSAAAEISMETLEAAKLLDELAESGLWDRLSRWLRCAHPFRKNKPDL